MAFQHETGNWVNYRTRFRLLPDDEIDLLHFGLRDTREQSYADVMDDVRNLVVERLQRAQTDFRPYVMFTHGGQHRGPETPLRGPSLAAL